MTLHPLLKQLLLPDKRSVIFACKGLLALALALFISMYLQLENPYWALVSAVFLQLRPESGLVIEKAVCQMVGTVVGGLVGVFILAFLMPYPLLALACVNLWVGLNSMLASLVHRNNYTYAFAMSGMTAALVVLLVMADVSTASSAQVFAIAQARISELTVGVICGMLVSQLVWPVTVKDGLRGHARKVINGSLAYLVAELNRDSAPEHRHQSSDQVFEALIALNDDSSAVVYEGPEGPGRGRAATLLCNKTMSLLAKVQVLGRFQRGEPEQMSPAFTDLLHMLCTHFEEIIAATHFTEAYEVAQALRRKILDHRSQSTEESAVISRLTQTALDLSTDLAMMLKAYNALEERDRTLLKSSELQTYREPLVGIVNGFRTAVVFFLGALLWLQTASAAAILMMITPVVYSITYARYPQQTLTSLLKRLLAGVVCAIPVALLMAGVLFQSNASFEMLILVLAAPYVVGLLALANTTTLPYGLGFCISFTLIIQPSNPMVFAADTAVSTALGLLVGILMLYWVFKLIAQPDTDLLQRRLLKSIAKDLVHINQQESPEAWFNNRMAERLLRLVNYDQADNPEERYMTELGLTGLHLGYVILQVWALLKPNAGSELEAALQTWHQGVVTAYLASAKGRVSRQFPHSCAELLRVLESCEEGDALGGQRLTLIQGMCQSQIATFERAAASVAAARKRRHPPKLEVGSAQLLGKG